MLFRIFCCCFTKSVQNVYFRFKMAETYVTLTSYFVTITTNFHQIVPKISSILLSFWKEELLGKIIYKNLLRLPPSPSPMHSSVPLNVNEKWPWKSERYQRWLLTNETRIFVWTFSPSKQDVRLLFRNSVDERNFILERLEKPCSISFCNWRFFLETFFIKWQKTNPAVRRTFRLKVIP